MKKIITLTFILFTTYAFSQNKNTKTTIEVDGVCFMCKHRIEKAAIKTKGVKTAVWNISTHKLELIYNQQKTDLKTIQSNIANSGHDTKLIKAKAENYNAIDPCCKYRDEQVVKNHEKN